MQSDKSPIFRVSKRYPIVTSFETLNIGLLSDCIVFHDGTKFCSNEEYTLKFYINGKKVDELRDYIIFDGDLILISYGSENQKEIAEELAELKSRGFPFKFKEKNNDFFSQVRSVPISLNHFEI